MFLFAKELHLMRAAAVHCVCDASHPQLVGHQGPERTARGAHYVLQGMFFAHYKQRLIGIDHPA